MKSNQTIEQKLEYLAAKIASRDSVADEIISRIDNSPVRHSKKKSTNHVFRRILMKKTFKLSAAAIILIAAFLSLTILNPTVPNVMASEVLTSVLQRSSRANVSKGDYLRNKFIQNAERTYFFYFNPETKILEGIQMVVHTDDGDILVFEITDIVYNPEIADDHFNPVIPEDAIFSKEPEILPDNEKYANMTPKEAAQAIFAACAAENWDEVSKFEAQSHVSNGMKQAWRGLEIILIGDPFQSEGYGGWYVPYEIKVKSGRVIKHNLALINDNSAKRWVIDGGRVY